MYMPHPFSTHSLVNTGYFCVLVIINNPAVHTGCGYLFEVVIMFPYDMYPSSGIAVSYASYIFKFLRKLYMFHNS